MFKLKPIIALPLGYTGSSQVLFWMIALQQKFGRCVKLPLSPFETPAGFRGRFVVAYLLAAYLLNAIAIAAEASTPPDSPGGSVSAISTAVPASADVIPAPADVVPAPVYEVLTPAEAVPAPAGKVAPLSGKVTKNEATEAVCTKPALKPDPKWHKDLEKGNLVLPKLIQAISGRPNSDETEKLLRGVIKILYENHEFKLVREDSSELKFGPDTILGDRIIQSLERTRRDTDKYSQNLGSVISGLRGVSVTDNHVELLREGPDDLRIALSAGKKMIPIKLKEIRLRRLSMDLDESKGYPTVRNISGLEVIVTAGVDFHITLKEFSRTKNAKGDTTVTFGILNPLPKAFRSALGLKEISYFSHTVRKKVERPA